MKKLILTLGILLLTIFTTKSQSVSGFVGGAIKNTFIFGVEFRSDSYGIFVERYGNKQNYPKYVMPSNQSEPSEPMWIVYDGVVFGVNKYIERLSNITLSAGIGYLNEYYIYNEGNGNRTMNVNQKFAFEFSVGKSVILQNHIVVGARAGVNNRTSIFGLLLIGYKL